MPVYKTKRKTKDGRQYYFRVNYTDVFGMYQFYNSKYFMTKKEAEIEESKFRIKLNQTSFSASTITFKQAFTEFRESMVKQMKPQSLLKLNKYWNHFSYLDDKKINSFNVNDTKKLISTIESKDLSINYKNKLLNTFKRVVNYSNLYYNTSNDFLKFITNFKEVNKQKKEMDFFTYDEFQKFISVIDDFDYKVFFEVLYFLGLRQGEAQALKWSDIKGKELKIDKTLTTKLKGVEWTISSPKTANSNRTLPIPANVYNDIILLKRDAMQYNDFSEEWFIFGNSIPFKESTIQKRKNLYCDKAGLRHIRIHDFRHSCASLLINQGASIVLVSKYLGHSKVSTTLDVYSHFYKNELDTISDLIGKL